MTCPRIPAEGGSGGGPDDAFWAKAKGELTASAIRPTASFDLISIFVFSDVQERGDFLPRIDLATKCNAYMNVSARNKFRN